MLPLILGEPEHTTNNNHTTAVRLLQEADSGAAQEHYRDEVDGGQILGPENANGRGPRVEPSGITAGHGSELWRESV